MFIWGDFEEDWFLFLLLSYLFFGIIVVCRIGIYVFLGDVVGFKEFVVSMLYLGIVGDN